MRKDEYRKICKTKIKKSIIYQAKCLHYGIIDEISKIIKKSGAKRVLIFIPLKYEPNLLLLTKKTPKNVKFFVPFMVDVSLKMVRLRRPFKISKFGVRECVNENDYFKTFDLAVVPVIGVDGRMARIGHGKGFYDMFFSGLNFKPIVVFTSVVDCFTKEFITEKHDIIGDFYVTPKKIYKRGNHDRNYNRLMCRTHRHWDRICSS